MKAFNFPVLQQQAATAYSQIEEKLAEEIKDLTKQQLDLIKKSITLSDFIYDTLIKFPDIILPVFTSFSLPIHRITELMDYSTLLTRKLEYCECEEELYYLLRRFRNQEMVRIAISDIIFNVPLENSLKALSELADSLILGCLKWLTNFYQKQWGTPCCDGKPQLLIVLAMGKLGGKELNFSSDIDLIFTFPETGFTKGVRRVLSNQEFFTRLGQKLIHALDKVTVDGFVYRVDMRLRPFGGSGPLVMNFNAVEDYYQEQGRDWERYAMLKARILGESEYNDSLEKKLKPFVYRRYIDFSVFESLRKMKLLIAQEVRRKQLVNNIKLGAGGIREIEFIVQVFQLIRGGREPSLQERHLLSVLPLLSNFNELSQKHIITLNNAYRFLRRVENIIQAITDQQTQTLPEKEIDQIRLIHILNYDSWLCFLDDITQHMEIVHQIFIDVIGEKSPNNQTADECWQTLWLSNWSIEETTLYIEENIPLWPKADMAKAIDAFKLEIAKCRIGQRGYLVLDKLMPILFEHIKNIDLSVIVFKRICLILKAVISRTVYLELLYENKKVLTHLIKLTQEGAWFVDYISQTPILLDELINPDFLLKAPTKENYADELRQILLRVPDDLEANMEALRHFKKSHLLRIAAADIMNVLPIMEVSDHLTLLAETILAQVIDIAWQQITEKHGKPKSLIGQDNKGLLVLGYGKLGGMELNYNSDLDLVFIHNCKVSELTDRDKAISAVHFYIKLVQKIMMIFNARMASGILYELDLRLRPSGNAGLLAVNMNSFLQYQKNEAWTWEHQALVRARAVYSDSYLLLNYLEIRKKVIGGARKIEQLKKEVNQMREKMRENLDESNQQSLDIKQGIGGLVDIEFIVQYLVLLHAYNKPQLVNYTDNIRLLSALKCEGILTKEQDEVLNSAYQFLRKIGHRANLKEQENIIKRTDISARTNMVTEIYQQILCRLN